MNILELHLLKNFVSFTSINAAQYIYQIVLHRKSDYLKRITSGERYSLQRRDNYILN